MIMQNLGLFFKVFSQLGGLMSVMGERTVFMCSNSLHTIKHKILLDQLPPNVGKKKDFCLHFFPNISS